MIAKSVRLKTVAASVIVLFLGVWSIAAITEGFKVVTAEQARRLDIARTQPAVPDVRLIDQSGQVFRFGNWVQQGNRFLIVDFIYTNCQSLCRVLGTRFQQLQRNIVERGLQDRVHLLSISFDPEHDSDAVLRQYAKHMQSDAEVWTLATVVNAGDLEVLLRTFGVTVIPDQLGGFQHNAALIWVAPSGKLVRVMDNNSDDALGLLDELVK